jgi:hypothetical protein
MTANNVSTVHKTSSDTPFRPLTNEEAIEFVQELDADNDGFVTFGELAAKFKEVQAEITGKPRNQDQSQMGDTKVSHQSGADLEKGANPEQDGIHDFLCSLMPDCGLSFSRDELIKHVKAWNVPSQNQNCAEDQEQEVSDYEEKLSVARRARAYWAIHGPKKLFRGFVTLLQVAFGLWQLLAYIYNTKTWAAFGWGVVVAKGSAGVLYPTLFFM